MRIFLEQVSSSVGRRCLSSGRRDLGAWRKQPRAEGKRRAAGCGGPRVRRQALDFCPLSSPTTGPPRPTQAHHTRFARLLARHGFLSPISRFFSVTLLYFCRPLGLRLSFNSRSPATPPPLPLAGLLRGVFHPASSEGSVVIGRLGLVR